ncbi:MAG: YabP/YqfC family sporulation protein [Clostridia bacterium]|nr:YabP/YqfC family sporulation protein [Clostridia bacterium]
MGFKENINAFFGLCNVGGCPFRITVLGEVGVYVEGAVRVIDVKDGEVAIEVKNAKLCFYGKGLSLGSFCDKDLTVKGKVEKIVWQ